ncbi:MAG: GNAT family N-acetyltransferase [Chloroflexota bacterium]
MPPSATELLDIQRSALFIEDANQKLRYIREPGYDESELYPAPRFFMSRTASRNAWSFRYDVPHDICEVIERLCLNEPIVTDFCTPYRHMNDIREILSGHTPISDEWRGPAYWIPEQTDLSEHAVLITESNAHFLETYFPWKITSRANFKTSPLVATIINDVAVSICYCARITKFAAEAGVETVKDFRGEGRAGQAVAKWAEIVRRKGIMPLYSTSWENVASQRVANKLKLTLYGENWHIT